MAVVSGTHEDALSRGVWLTVGDLLADPALSGARLLAGAEGLGNAIADVTWWDGRGLADVENHLLVHEATRPLPTYLLDAGLHRAGAFRASGILQLGAIEQPVGSTLRLADRLALPLLALSTSRPRAVSDRLALAVRSPAVAQARQISDFIHLLRSHRRSPEFLLEAFRKVAGVDVAVIAGDGTPLLGTPPALPSTIRLDVVAPHRLPHASGVLLLQPVSTRSIKGTSIWLVCEFPSSVGPWFNGAIDLLVILEPAVAAWLADERLVAEHNSPLRTRLLAQVLSGGDTVSPKVAHQAVAAGWRLHGWHTGIHIGMREPAQPHDSRDLVVMQLDRVRRALQAEGLDGPVVERQDGWVAWVTSLGEPADVDKRHISESVRAVLTRLPAPWAAYAGIGRPHGGIAGIAATLAEAHDAATLARREPADKRVKHVDELGVARLLLAWRSSEDVRAHANSVLSPIREVNGGQLLETLRAYLDNSSSLGQTAEALNLHRNTVAARLHRARELLGIDLDNPEERLAVSIACRIVEQHQ